MALTEYTVDIGGVPHKVLLDDTEAVGRDKRYVSSPFGPGSTKKPGGDGNPGVVDVRDYGTDRAGFIRALDAAEARAPGTVVYIAAGVTVDVGSGVSMAGRTAQIWGDGAGSTASSRRVSVIKASTQNGPVLDFDGYLAPQSFFGRVTPLRGVAIQGSGVADATKKNSGLRFTFLCSSYVSDVSISDTGGPCIEMAPSPGMGVYLNTFERITFMPPVAAEANDVPWFYGNECNGNNFRDFGFRGTTATGQSGASGVVVLEGNSSYRLGQLVMTGWWFEYVHPANGGTLISIAANMTTLRDVMFYDCLKQNVAHTGTSHVRYLPSIDDVTKDTGGNAFYGVVPGSHAPNTIDTGIDIRQRGITVIGPKAYKGRNVTLAAGVKNCSVHLTAGQGNAADPGWIDNSAQSSNHLLDEFLGVEVAPRTIKVSGVRRTAGAGNPEGQLIGNIGDEFIRTDGELGVQRYLKGRNSGTVYGWYPVRTEDFFAATLTGATQSIPFASGTSWKYTLTANQTFSSVTGGRNGAVLTLMIAQDATGGRAVTWPSTIKWAGGAAPALSAAANKVDVFTFMFDGAAWREVSRSIGT